MNNITNRVGFLSNGVSLVFIIISLILLITGLALKSKRKGNNTAG